MAFRGLDQVGIPGIDRTTTRTLQNVEARDGRILGRGGIKKFKAITTVSPSTPILGLMAFMAPSGATDVLRMTPTQVHKLNTGTNVWDDVTGTALAGNSSTRPQWTNHKSVLCFTNEGSNRPRKYTGSGNTADLGGTPPFSKAMTDYTGFLMLGNISTDGATFFPRRIVYSEDFDVDWTTCEGNEINLEETNGEIRAMKPLGLILPVYKSDAVIGLRQVGGLVRFTQEKMRFDKGIEAPLSLAEIAELGHIFLGTDLELYLNQGSSFKALPPNVQKKLQETMDPAKAGQAVGQINPDRETYELFYPASTADTWSRGRISYNFRSGEFHHKLYDGHQFVRSLAFRFSNSVRYALIASTNDLVYELDTSDANDDGTKIDRFYDTDWQHFGSTQQKRLKGVDLVFKRSRNVRIKISIALDYKEKFLFERSFNLIGRAGETDAVIEYVPPQPFKGTFFNLKVRMFHDATDKAELTAALFRWEPTGERIKARENRQAATV